MRQNTVSRVLSLFLLLGFAALLLIYPQESSMAAKEGLQICFNLIIPSLFPFFVLSSLLVSLGFATLLGKLLKNLMWPLFRLSPPCASAIVLGSVGGYPVGARITAQLYEDQQCTQSDALRLSVFCNNCGPAFLFSVAGWGIFSSKAAGLLLMGTHLMAALLVGFLFRFVPLKGETQTSPLVRVQSKSLSAVFPDCVRDSFTSTLNVCAFVVLFSVLLRLASCSGALPFAVTHLSALFPFESSPAFFQSLIAGTFEISSGIYSLSQLSATPAALPLAAFLLAWGGISVHCQAMPFLKRCVGTLRPYFLGKLFQALLAAAMTALLAPLLLPQATSTMLPLQTLAPSPSFQLFREEMLALWLLSALFFFVYRKKGLVKARRLIYNKREP